MKTEFESRKVEGNKQQTINLHNNLGTRTQSHQRLITIDMKMV